MNKAQKAILLSVLPLISALSGVGYLLYRQFDRTQAGYALYHVLEEQSGQPPLQDEISPLLRRGADLREPDGSGNAVLLYAARGGFGGLMQRSLRAGADINAMEETTGRTPLWYAVSHPNPELVRFMISQGARTNIPDSDGRTPLHAAVLNGGPPQSILFMLDAGADLEAQDDAGRTPLSLAASAGVPLEYLSTLLERGAEIDARDGEGQTPLHRAVRDGVSREKMHVLLEAGADPRLRDHADRDAFALARETERTDILRLLERYR